VGGCGALGRQYSGSYTNLPSMLFCLWRYHCSVAQVCMCGEQGNSKESLVGSAGLLSWSLKLHKWVVIAAHTGLFEPWMPTGSHSLTN
jgi:hypothetical protein